MGAPPLMPKPLGGSDRASAINMTIYSNTSRSVESIMSHNHAIRTALQFQGEVLYHSLYDHLARMKAQHQPFNDLEHALFILLALPLEAELYGFANVFIHLYSLHECIVFENTLETIGLRLIADQFREARTIYTNDDSSMSEETYRAIDITKAPDRLRRILQIGDQILTDQLQQAIAISLRSYLQHQCAGMPPLLDP